MLHCAGDAVQLPNKFFELFRTAKVQVAVPQKSDGQHHENRQADGQCGEYHVEEQRIEGCERWSQWRLQMQAPEGRIQQRGRDDKRRGEIAISPGKSGNRKGSSQYLMDGFGVNQDLQRPLPLLLTFDINRISLLSRSTSMAPDQSRLDLLQGTLDLLILRALRTDSMHGWAISERIQQISQNVLQVNQGSLYPALHRLEHRGWIKAGWGVSELGRRARFYSLTSAGRRQLEVEAENWNKLTEAIARVLRMA